MVNRGFSGRRRIVAQTGPIGADVLASAVGSRSLDEVLSAVERREILAALARACGQRTKAANLLGISRSRLYRRMEALGIRLDHDT